MDLSRRFPLTVEETEAGQRLDRFLVSRFPAVSRSQWNRLIEQGALQSSGQRLEPATKLRAGQIIECPQPRAFHEELKEEKLEAQVSYQGPPVSVLFEDEDLLVLNKPEGLSVHPGHGQALADTLVGWLIAAGKIKSDQNGAFLEWGEDLVKELRPGIVHRLDRGTSGALVVAKNPATHAALSEQFAERKAGRIYWAVVKGPVDSLLYKRPSRVDRLLQSEAKSLAFKVEKDEVFSLASFLERDPGNRIRFRVSPLRSGRKAITHFKSLVKGSSFSLLEVKLETGRTHQIRVHLSFLGFPILGDTLYGGAPHPRVLLHARQIAFVHPSSQKEMRFQAPLLREDEEWLKSQGLYTDKGFFD